MSPAFDRRDMAKAAATDAANPHRPTSREVLLREALRLKAQGLRPRDIAELFNLNPADIESLIEGDEPGTGSV
jgi:hypothetical protein